MLGDDHTQPIRRFLVGLTNALSGAGIKGRDRRVHINTDQALALSFCKTHSPERSPDRGFRPIQTHKNRLIIIVNHAIIQAPDWDALTRRPPRSASKCWQPDSSV